MNELDHGTDIHSTQNVVLPNALPPHQYPVTIRLFWCVVFFLSLICITRFLLYELPRHKDMYVQLQAAQKAFDAQEYSQAIVSYTKLVDEYPNFKEGRMLLAKSYFALIEQEQHGAYYRYGILCLGDHEYSSMERDDIKSYLPREYRYSFENIWASA